LKVCRSHISFFYSFLKHFSQTILNSIDEGCWLIDHGLMHNFIHHVLKCLRISWEGDMLRPWQRIFLEDPTFSLTIWSLA
jgi:hypothetical protein